MGKRKKRKKMQKEAKQVFEQITRFPSFDQGRILPLGSKGLISFDSFLFISLVLIFSCISFLSQKKNNAYFIVCFVDPSNDDRLVSLITRTRDTEQLIKRKAVSTCLITKDEQGLVFFCLNVFICVFTFAF